MFAEWSPKLDDDARLSELIHFYHLLPSFMVSSVSINVFEMNDEIWCECLEGGGTTKGENVQHSTDHATDELWLPLHQSQSKLHPREK